MALRSLLLLPLLLLSPRAGAAPDPREATVSAMKAELDRSMQRLRLPGYEAAYFVSYLLRAQESCQVVARYGATYTDGCGKSRAAYVEVRVGDYSFDNSSPEPNSETIDLEELESYTPGVEGPVDDDPAALRTSLWLLTDQKYKKALTELHKRRAKRAMAVVDPDTVASFSREKPESHRDAPRTMVFSRPKWAERAKRASVLLHKHPEIFDSIVKVTADHVVRSYVSSEGATHVSERLVYGLHLEGAARAADGMYLEHERSFYADSEAGLPSDADLAAAVERLASELIALRNAPALDPYSGPAILLPEAAGVFFHEALGHRLEGERLLDEKEGRTFKGQLGKRVVPTFLSIYDDPTLASAMGKPLNGHYDWDDEGTRSRRVTLVDKGILRGYLKSRTPVLGDGKSNGHARAEGVADPMARMGVLVVEATEKKPYAQLKKMLLDEVRRQNKPFGLIVSDIVGGSTNTSNYEYQAFKGQARLVYKVDAKTGAETVVRGVEFVGTPLTFLNKLVAAASDRAGVFNGYCGAESGLVLTSTVAPAVLMSEIELQRQRKGLARPPILGKP